MKGRRLGLGAAIVVLASGLFLLANATIIAHETRQSISTSNTGGPLSGKYFIVGGAELSPDNPPLIVVGTEGVSIAMLIQGQSFFQWICDHTRASPAITGSGDYCGFGGGDLNVTILYPYLETHQSQILYSQTIANQNITLDYRVAAPITVAVVLAPLDSSQARNYMQLTQSNETVTYPLLGWTEQSGSSLTLTNVSRGVLLAGIVLLVVSLFTEYSLQALRSVQQLLHCR